MNPPIQDTDTAPNKGATGPVTEAGKLRSSMNARKHDFFTRIAALPDEEQSEFHALLADFAAEHQPATPTERRYVREMADAEFRLNRVRHYAAQAQCNAYDSESMVHSPMASAFQKLADESQTLQLCLRYEKHFQRQFDSALKMLLTLKKRRPEVHPPAPPSEDLKKIAFRLKVMERVIFGSEIDDSGSDDGDEFEDDDPTLQNEPDIDPPIVKIRL